MRNKYSSNRSVQPDRYDMLQATLARGMITERVILESRGFSVVAGYNWLAHLFHTEEFVIINSFSIGNYVSNIRIYPKDIDGAVLALSNRSGTLLHTDTVDYIINQPEGVEWVLIEAEYHYKTSIRDFPIAADSEEINGIIELLNELRDING